MDQLAAAQAARAEKEKQAVEAVTSSSESSDNEAEALLKGGVSTLKNKWKKMRGSDDATAEKHKTKMSFRLTSLLVYTVGVKCHGLHPDIEYAPEHIFSLSENAANRFVKASMTDLVKHTHTHLVRVYPKGTRVNSTNFEPNRYWASGCQVVAINWQTFGRSITSCPCSRAFFNVVLDLGYMINQAMFQRNGRAGFVLKPEALRHPEKAELLSKRTQHFFDITVSILYFSPGVTPTLDYYS